MVIIQQDLFPDLLHCTAPRRVVLAQCRRWCKGGTRGSRFHRIPGWARLEGITVAHLVPPPCSRRVRAQGTELCPDSSGISPVSETPHPLWTISVSAQRKSSSFTWNILYIFFYLFLLSYFLAPLKRTWSVL